MSDIDKAWGNHYNAFKNMEEGRWNMNKILNKLERKMGRYAVPNLIVWLLAGYAIGFVLMRMAPGVLNLMTLEPYYILHGQVWRLLT